MPGQAARAGQPSRRAQTTSPNTTDPHKSLPRANAPGENSRPALRIATNADAHNTTVTAAAASARRRYADSPGAIEVMAKIERVGSSHARRVDRDIPKCAPRTSAVATESKRIGTSER